MAKPKIGLGKAFRVQGIDSDFNDLVLRDGRKFHLLVGNVTAADLTRTIEGASSIAVQVLDPHAELLNSTLLHERFDIRADGLWFRSVKIPYDSQTKLTGITFEDRLIAYLRLMGGPVKAFRDQMTRAEFVKMLVDLTNKVLGVQIGFYAPELHVVQPIAGSGPVTDSSPTREADAMGAPGFESGANLTVKGVKATAAQKNVAARALSVADGLNAPFMAMVAMITAGINESTLEDLSGGDRDSVGFLQVRFGRARTVEDQAKLFLLSGATGYKNSAGAIELAKTGEPLQSWLGNMWYGVGSTYPGLQYVSEARKWVEAWTGSGGTLGGGTTQTKEERFPFEVGKNEDFWTAIVRLAKEVNWRVFPVGQKLWYIAEPDLFAQKVWLRVRRGETPGVERVAGDYDQGKPITQVDLTCRVKQWAAPPGTVVTLEDFGPFSVGDYFRDAKDQIKGLPGVQALGQARPVVGRYIVSSIATPMIGGRSHLATVTLKKPTQPLPEPAPQTRTVASPGGGPAPAGVSGAGAERMIKWAKSVLGTQEGSSLQRKWAAAAGVSASVPWCSVFISYGLVHICGLKPPSNPAYSGTWMEGWSDGSRVGKGGHQAGDLLIFDWGDGGITDHIALDIGGGQMIGGNDSNNEVGQSTIPSGNIVGVVRPHYKT